MALVKPEELSQLKNLLLVAKTVVDSLYLGIHPGKNRGVGTEFEQYRTYQPGDDIRRIDWKMFARSDRYYIQESQVESSIIIRFIIDSSASMLMEENKVSKWSYATMLAATMGYLAFQQGDSIGLFALNTEEIVTLEPRRAKAHLNQFLYHLETVKPKGKWPKWSELRRYLESSSKKELWIILSDCMSEDDSWFETMHKLSGLGKDISVLQILHSQEIDLPKNEAFEAVNLETNKKKTVFTDFIKKAYQTNFENYQQELKKMQSEMVDWSTCKLSDSLHLAIEQFIKHRARM